jgi:ATP-dependent exoDNAse (exonuclease V) beta subunit
MTWTTMSDEANRERIRTAIDDTLIVEAAAGTGKTTELIERIVQVLTAGRATIQEIVGVTFTEKAAGELKLRLRERLEARRQVVQGEEAARLEAAVQNLEEAHVNTIHGFCADLLRERPVEARVDPLFNVLTEAQSERLFAQAFEGWFHGLLEDPPEGVRRSLRRTSRGQRPGQADEDGPVVRLRKAGFELTQWRDFSARWTREPFDRAAVIPAVVAIVHRLADLSANASYQGDNLFLDTAPVRRLSQHLRSALGDPDDPDGLEARLIDLHKDREFRRLRKGTGPTYAKGVTRAQVLEARDALVFALNEFQMRADADLAALLRDELLECIERYEALKRREGALDFLDLLLRARNLVQGNRSVREHFQKRFRRIFVDEFQDTDPLQAELLILLSAQDPDETDWERVVPEPGKLFIVGDPKQSIYRFRRADVDIYSRVCQQLTQAGGHRLELRQSFRSVPNIQCAVNAAFAPIMDGDAESLQAHYMPLERFRDPIPGQPSIVALPVPKPYGQRYISSREIERSLPDAVGAYVDWLVRQSHWRVTERREPGRLVPLEPRHVCILFRRFVSFGEDITRPYVEALEARGVRHLLVGGRTFHDREEIETLRATLLAIEWPDDQLSVFATLRGALFAIGDEDLLEYRQIAGRFHPYRIPDALPAHLHPVRQALELLAALHRRRNRRPVADTVMALLDHTRAHVGFVLRPAGEQALANVLHVAELARQYEMSGGMSFRGFVDAFQAEAEAGSATEAPILEEGSEGVRLMTVHKAKGLEFPVVILADITARLTPYEAGRFIDHRNGLCAVRIGGWSPKDLLDNRDLELLRERREGERVAYVAATRARDLLVVPAIGDEPYNEGWVAPLHGAIYPAEEVRRTAADGEGCPSFRSRDTVLNRPDGDPATPRTMCPGTHVLGEPPASHSVVWWSPEPEALTLGAQAPLGLRRDDLIVKDVPPSVLRGYLDAYTNWRETRRAAIAAASEPSVRVRTATEAAESADASLEPIDVTVESLSGDDGRPRGARFGSLVHALLSDVAAFAGETATAPHERRDRSRDALSRIALVHGRILGATPAEVAAAADVAERVLAHPLLVEAAGAAAEGRCHRETPVTYRRDDGSLVEGTVDLAFESADGYVVIDFKTDRPAADALERYRRQVAWYAAAIARATGKPARAVVMTV